MPTNHHNLGSNSMAEQQAHFSSNKKRLPHIKHIVAVGSGKGGVGKSTTCLNLAFALKEQGHQVGLLDADIYGPNQPHMLGEMGKPQITEGQFHPINTHGLTCMSMGFLVDRDTPMIWRGPMITKALHQMLFQTKWPSLDYLLIDLPPGTGDVQLSLVKNLHLNGAIIVTTPQDIAALDARKGLEMFRKVDVDILGVIENMSTHTCSQCGHNEAIFGQHGGGALAEQTQTELLGQLPLDINIRQACDDGQPLQLNQPHHSALSTYANIAQKISDKLRLQSQRKSTTFPDIVVE